MKLKTIINSYSEIVKYSSIFFTGIFLFNILNTLFNIIAARGLGPILYGELGAIASILYLFSIPNEVIGTLIIKFASKFNAEKKFEKLKSFFLFSTKVVTIIYISIILSLLLLSPFIISFLKLSSSTYLLLFLVYLLVSIPLISNRAFMQALIKFKSLSINLVAESALKCLFTICVLYIGFKLNAIFVAIIISALIVALTSFIPLRKIFKYSYEKINTKGILSNSRNISFLLIGLAALYSFDIFLAKHFLLPVDAGNYVALSLLGKTIFFGSTAIVKPMFAKLFEKDASEKRKLALKAASLVALGSGVALIGFLIFPNLIVSLLFGKEYLQIAPYLFKFGLAMSLFSFSFLIAHYNISKENKRGTLIFPLFAVIEIVLIYFMHNSIGEITLAMLITMSGLFLVTIIFPIINKIYRGIKK